jgi:hypothetical protein
LNATAQNLKILAALVWLLGGVILVVKGISLLFDANTLQTGQIGPWLGLLLGILLGALQAKYLFVNFGRKNLARIDGLNRPKLWQFFRPGFFLALALMIAAGVILSRMAVGNFIFLIGVAALDLIVGISLLGSIYVFWPLTPGKTVTHK